MADPGLEVLMHGGGARRPTEARMFSNGPRARMFSNGGPSDPLRRSSSRTGAFLCA